ncbi:electron transfer flavoprotein beta subunit lysine methyltransferase isoform X2 [Cottoperca gobio]|uniref:Electron transfer flavoprotein beta subunit lysine methyltransferase n=1 Tax=Cottoperca gobio TaxID=56716 RepID=A0A6J2PXL4_COTGO|nr:electron transfer flavoprotein beta subunit lysine methyltransferase isoform X2 [Cottoperca gobio]
MVMLGLLTPQTRGVKVFIKAFRQTNRPRCSSVSCHSDEYIRRFISDNTEIVGDQSLTPEVKLRLFTPTCRFWRERPELWPFEDPYWAIYWPGGQALSRFLLDNPSVCGGKTVLDLGSGCGATAIAAKLCGAAHVVANDIDTDSTADVAMSDSGSDISTELSDSESSDSLHLQEEEFIEEDAGVVDLDHAGELNVVEPYQFETQYSRWRHRRERTCG